MNTQTAPSAIPTREFLDAHINATWELHHPQLAPLQARLVRVDDAGAMNKKFVCYSAEFALVDGERPHSLTYTAHCGEHAWPLLLTAIGPDEDGQELLQLIIHTHR